MMITREDCGIYAALQIGRNSTLEVRRMILDLMLSIMAAIIMACAGVRNTKLQSC
jgi:hypothetical protein